MKKNKQLGLTLSSLGGLVVIFNFTIWKESEWGLLLAVLAVVLIFAGIIISAKAKKA